MTGLVESNRPLVHLYMLSFIPVHHSTNSATVTFNAFACRWTTPIVGS
jgi:hypothetical protein